MDPEYIKRVQRAVTQSAVYVPADCEGIRIDVVEVDEELFHGHGEESGAEYTVTFEEVDLKHDLFYALTLVDTEL